MYVDMELSKPFTPSPAYLFKAQEREPEGEAAVSSLIHCTRTRVPGLGA